MPLLRDASHTRERRLSCGLGQCRICSCPAFKGHGNICEDCGHHYGDHTTKPFRTGATGSRQYIGTGYEAAEGGVSR
jgi:hypothetical protein